MVRDKERQRNTDKKQLLSNQIRINSSHILCSGAESSASFNSKAESNDVLSCVKTSAQGLIVYDACMPYFSKTSFTRAVFCCNCSATKSITVLQRTDQSRNEMQQPMAISSLLCIFVSISSHTQEASCPNHVLNLKAYSRTLLATPTGFLQMILRSSSGNLFYFIKESVLGINSIVWNYPWQVIAI